MGSRSFRSSLNASDTKFVDQRGFGVTSPRFPSADPLAIMTVASISGRTSHGRASCWATRLSGSVCGILSVALIICNRGQTWIDPAFTFLQPAEAL